MGQVAVFTTIEDVALFRAKERGVVGGGRIAPRLTRMPVVSSAVAAVSALAIASPGLVATAVAAPPQERPVAARHLAKLPTDPYTDAAGQPRNEVEPAVATAGNTVVAAYQVGRLLSGGADNIGFALSKNDGHTWTGGVLAGITKVAGGPWGLASDPSIAYDARHHVWLIGAVDGVNGRGDGISVSRSTDGGHHWSGPSSADFGTTYFYDKDWVVCDNHLDSSRFAGTCYLTFEDGISQQVFMQRSTDGGKHWSAPVKPAGSAIGQGGEPVVQPHGKVVVPYVAPTAVESFLSLNGGASWTNPVKVADLHERTFGTAYRTYATPSVGIAGDGKVFAVWQGCEPGPTCTTDRVLMSTSTNGFTWSSPTRVRTGAQAFGVDSMTPAIAVDGSTGGADARIAITYYNDDHPGCAAPCALSAETVTSQDVGKHWSKPLVLAKGINTSWLAKTSIGPMVGDYIGETFASKGNAVGVFVVAKPPTGTTLHERVVANAQHIS